MNVHDREEALVARLHELAPHLDGEPDPAFRAATRDRLVAMAAVRTPVPAPPSRLQRLLAVRAPDVAPARWRSRLTAGLAGAALTVTALAGLVAVADGARPGDALYELKRGTEQTQLALAGDSRGQTLLDFASTRLGEVQALVEPRAATGSADGVDPALVLETLQAMDEQTTEGAVWLTERAVSTGQAQPLDHLDGWAAGQAGALAGLQPVVPEEAGDAVAQSLTLLADIGARTSALQAALACPGGPATAGTDGLGPVPAPCPAPEPAPAPPPPAEETTEPGTGGAPATTAPEETAPRPPAVPPDATDEVPAPRVPTSTTPRLPLPLPLPTERTAPSSTIVQLPPLGPVEVCLPPLVTVGC